MKIAKLRADIDRLDARLIALLNRRARLSARIGQVKNRLGASVYAPDREKQIFQMLARVNTGPLPTAVLKSIYREIMSASISLERPTRIAYLGPECTFTHLAALKKFGTAVDYVACGNITDVFNQVEKRNADYGVVPIENSTEGAVNHTLDMFIDSDLRIYSEIYLSISQNLISRERSLSRVKTVYSKAEVFAQCRNWLEEHLPMARLIDAPSTAQAAQIAAHKANAGAIGSALAADRYGLRVLSASIEDAANNITRFLVIGTETVLSSTRDDKTSFMISIAKDRVGALHDMLVPFKKTGINLTKIESRPSKMRAWEYYFFVDIEGHISDRKVKRALAVLEREHIFVKLLGSYPAGEMVR